MSTTYMTEKTSIRLGGKVVTFVDITRDCDSFASLPGRRRERQIAKRHWVKKEKSWWSSGGGGGEEVSVKTPGKKEYKEEKYWY